MVSTGHKTARITYDESAWPFVVIGLPTGAMSDEDCLELLSRLRGYFERGERFGCVIDVRGTSLLSASQRRLMAERMDEDHKRFPGIGIGLATILSSPLARGIFKALMWLRQHSEPPMKSFDTVEPALKWLRELYRAPRPNPARRANPP